MCKVTVEVRGEEDLVPPPPRFGDSEVADLKLNPPRCIRDDRTSPRNDIDASQNSLIRTIQGFYYVVPSMEGIKLEGGVHRSSGSPFT